MKLIDYAVGVKIKRPIHVNLYGLLTLEKGVYMFSTDKTIVKLAPGLGWDISMLDFLSGEDYEYIWKGSQEKPAPPSQ
jgi:hypothetical protein